MSRIHGIIDEIKELQKEKNHRSSLHIVRLLEANQKIFLEKMDAVDYNFILRNFEDLSQTQPKDYNSQSFLYDYEKSFESILFHLNKIV
ncbi:MAG: hypothetical protein H0W73_15415 [Bacteroidetes bacterium]|nr:hypothetical protein [Bacteroidota bacterium]